MKEKDKVKTYYISISGQYLELKLNGKSSVQVFLMYLFLKKPAKQNRKKFLREAPRQIGKITQDQEGNFR